MRVVEFLWGGRHWSCRGAANRTIDDNTGEHIVIQRQQLLGTPNPKLQFSGPNIGGGEGM